MTLDVLINEYGKGTLPYLSKSGGEKVKASLAVILALAEIKSSTAGMQLGMLFIDEPPFLDDSGVQAYCDALVTIQRRYTDLKIMAITHDPTMKARFPQGLTVPRTKTAAISGGTKKNIRPRTISEICCGIRSGAGCHAERKNLWEM